MVVAWNDFIDFQRARGMMYWFLILSTNPSPDIRGRVFRF